MKNDTGNANTHLSLEERGIIETGIRNGSTKTAIAETIGKDNSTIGKEIKLHRKLTARCSLPLECINYRKCKYDRNCTADCPEYSKFTCNRRDRSPGACNGCSKYSYCHFDKYTYSAGTADREYRESLVDSRAGYNITSQEAQSLAETIQPLLKNGLSPYAILQAHPEIGISEKTLYTYIENGVFSCLPKVELHIGPMDLRRQVNRKMTKKTAKTYKKREDRKYLVGRTYNDYQEYMVRNPTVFVTQMDTVYNDVTNGPFIQTFKFVFGNFLFGFYHAEKTAEEMKSGVNQLYEILGPETFRKYVHVLLTDRGSEFSAADDMEMTEDGTRRTRVFYCDPMRAGQKGTLENNHIELRYIIPKETDLKALGLVNQDALNLALCHINSIPIEKYGGKCPFDVIEFMYPALYEKMIEYGLKKIPADELILQPKLLTPFRTGAKTACEKKDLATGNVSDESNAPTKNADPVSAQENHVDETARDESVPKKRSHSGGRKPKESKLSPEEIADLISEGYPPREIAERMGISVATYYRRLAATKKAVG